MIKSLLVALTLIILGTNAIAQNTFSISGLVRDQKDGLPGASIYLSGYKIATVADNDGRFKLSNLKPGSYDLLVQLVGYLPYSKSVIISDKSVQVELVLKENVAQLDEVVIRADPNRQKYINQFKEFFIGKTPNATQCKILNPQVLNVDYDVTKSTLTVSTTEFLVVENKALGYRLKYMLDHFEYNSRTHIIYYSGHPFFEELKASAAKKKKYIAAREVAYYGSSQHFFRSLYANKTKEEGFIINKMIKIPNPNRYPQYIINTNIEKIKALPEKTGIRQNKGKIDTALLAFWTKQQEKPKTIDKFSRAEVLTDTLVHYFNKNLKYLSYTDALLIQYTKEKESMAYSKTGFWIFRPLDVPENEISVANLTGEGVRFYENGGIYDSRSLLFEGYWAYEKVADMVPMDYVPLPKKE
ncbi:carboxypeptidase-like regulatory domain-containing protein [Pedobacter alluvionis]|uniref:Carboxypeptidase-like protein n=1 Tax=Pedobacter alluvionis TaxID=475253 RepID=A0A497YDZ6_9SPHI|nr:carboxypeptidase-like regulatory domain-containing protein [Pedobacter alluvionis]RLJ80923.1 carboxypeptidase-like protein [Pedobacter alluvionis]TFB34118.1 carboxypeptidase-like regulatory domain-containing protein [Pedobacter alluvionis]